MPHDHRILIRLQPHELRRLHRLLKAIAAHRGYLVLLELGSKDAEYALDLLQRIPDIIPQVDTDNQQPATDNL